ncbi:MAG: methyltransferase domain-containing protein [Spirochaetales bacterium]|nr:methyltransferase domain-containing protein [Spirochaetales bacterium]
MLVILIIVAAFAVYFAVSNLISYRLLKTRILKERQWDLNICCGKTDGGGINADIFPHKDVPNFVRINSIYALPFGDRQFKNVLCSHTMEHVEDPQAFFNELQRVAGQVTIVIPPLWDLGAVLNFIEHKWIFLSMRKRHTALPRHTRLPFSHLLQRKIGQRIHA